MDPVLANFAMFCEGLAEMDLQLTATHGKTPEMNGDNRAFTQPGLDNLAAWYQFVRKYALVFLRKCVILLHVKFGVDFNSHVSPNPEQKELERLTEALRVPSFDEMVVSITPVGPQYGWPHEMHRLVGGWVRHLASWLLDDSLYSMHHKMPPSAVISHPAIFELVGLPKNYDTLIEECTRRKCPTKGKDLTDPTICLFCGDLFCSQAVCCTKELKEGRNKVVQLGGAQQHMRKYVITFPTPNIIH